MHAERLWQAAVGQLQMEMPRAAFETWVRDAQLLTYEDGEFVVGVQNAFARDWLDDRLRPTVIRVLSGIVGRTVEVRFVVWQAPLTDEPIPPATGVRDSAEAGQFITAGSRAAASGQLELRLNPRYTFENFVVGKSNRLAHAAARAVADDPAGPYNPLFLYGGVGLGKTHLLHAIAHACNSSGMQAMYVSSEDFTNDLIEAIRAHNTSSFRDRYRRVEVLLVDDVQFIAGKESTQEEFFHTFNALHGQDHQVVLSSDRPPSAFVTLEERLRSRFEWGLAADIQPPDLETRVAILRSKAERAGRPVDRELLELVAQRAQSNIRELEGALTRVLAYADLTGAGLSRQVIELVLSEPSASLGSVTPERIISAVAAQFGVLEDELLGARRNRRVSLPRQVAMYLLREETGDSLPKIGQTLGGRDHTTIMYGCERVAELLESDDRLRGQVMAIRNSLHRLTA